MGGSDLVIIALALVGYGLVSGRLAGSPITAPIVFTAIGIVFGVDVLGVMDIGIESDELRLLDEKIQGVSGRRR